MPGSAKTILESITDGFFSLNRQWEFTYVNGQACKFLGPSAEDLLGENVWHMFPGLLGTEFETLYRQAASKQEAVSLTAYYPDHECWYEVHVYPSDIGISVYFRDVTERMEAAEKLRESEARFRVMTDSIPQIVWIVDANGRGIFFNKQWSAYTGVSLESILPQDVSASFVHPDDHAHTVAAWEAAHRDGTVFSVEHRIRSAAGEYRWFLVRAEPYRDSATGEILRWFGTSTDVHDRKLAEAALQKSEARYRSLFESIDEGFCIVDMLFDENDRPCDYRFRETNLVFEQQSGLHDVIGKTIRELTPQHEQHWCDIYGDVALTGQPVRFQNEAKALNRWFDVYAFRVDEPSARRVSILFKDITEHRRFEQELQLSSQRKDEFLAMLAHELRNPLAPIGAAADLLRLADLDDSAIRQTSEIISRQVRHMTSLVDDLLDVSRVTRGLITLERLPLDIRRVAADAIEQARPLMTGRHHHFSAHMPPDPVFVLGDQKRLVQVIVNLLNNAAKYTPDGGEIALRIEAVDDRLDISVKDNGIGLAPDMLSQVFELFAQAEQGSDRSQGGLGIGLALVKSLVELHEGSVRASSEGIGTGSEFLISLARLTAPDQSAAPTPLGPSAGKTQGMKILIVEDNTDAARMLALFLEAAGHEVSVEHTPERAFARALAEKPEVCLLDIGLPDMDGYQLARRLRSQPETAESVLITITGYGQEQDRLNASAAGFDHHFVKPVDTARLLELLARLQERHDRR